MMKQIETVVWEPIPDKPNYVTKKSNRKVGEVFLELEMALKEAGLYPDEYLLLNSKFKDENMLCPEFSDVICYAQWGTNEGIYLEVDIVFLNENNNTYERANFATGKSLKEDKNSYDRMQYTAGYIYKLFMGNHQVSPRYRIVSKCEPTLREQVDCKILREYEEYLREIFVIKQCESATVAEEVGIRSLIIANYNKCELTDDKLSELLAVDNSLELLTKICRHVLEPDSFEITDTICACDSFEAELKRKGYSADEK